MRTRFYVGMLGIVIAILAVVAHTAPSAQPLAAATDLGGVATSVNGPEAGVWVRSPAPAPTATGSIRRH